MMQPWPEDAEQLIASIVSDRDAIESMIDVCIIEGCIERHYSLIGALHPLIRKRVIAIRTAARDINRMIPDGRGRPPKWSEISQNVFAIASDMRDLCNELPALIQSNRYLVVCEVLKDIGRGAKRMDEEIHQIPVPKSSDVPEIWREAFDD